jgi:hypothetical protein
MKKDNVAYFRVPYFLAAILLVSIFFLGFVTNMAITPKTEVATETANTEAKNVEARIVDGIVVKADYPNEAVVEFTLPKAIAPDFFVGYGLGRVYEIFTEDPETRDPMGIGTDNTMRLIKQIRSEVSGLTENVYAKGYELTITITKSHLDRKDQIIEEALVIIRDFLDNPSDLADAE